MQAATAIVQVHHCGIKEHAIIKMHQYGGLIMNTKLMYIYRNTTITNILLFMLK